MRCKTQQNNVLRAKKVAIPFSEAQIGSAHFFATQRFSSACFPLPVRGIGQSLCKMMIYSRFSSFCAGQATKKEPRKKAPLCGKRDSNSRPQPWQGCALPTELFPQYVSPSAKEAFNLPFRHPKLAFRDCKYKLKNLFCKIFRRILSQNDVPGLRKSRGHRMGNPYFRAAE